MRRVDRLIFGLLFGELALLISGAIDTLSLADLFDGLIQRLAKGKSFRWCRRVTANLTAA